MNPFSLKSIALNLAQNDTHAMQFISEAARHDQGPFVFEWFHRAGLKGEELGLLWRDICQCNIDNAIHLLKNVDRKVIVKTCISTDAPLARSLREYLQTNYWDTVEGEVTENKN